MAEVFGIVSGTVGIASAFSSCVEAFDYVQLSRRFGKDFETHRLTLTLLQLRLSRWGAAVGITSDPPFSLSQPDARPADIANARQAIEKISMLFEDSENVSRPYNSAGQRPEEGLPALSEADMNAFLRKLNKRMRKIAERRQKGVGFIKKVRWVLHDRERCSRLVEDITKLLDLLEQIFPAPEKRSAQLAREELEEIIGGRDGNSESLAEILNVVHNLADGVDEVIKAKALVMTEEGGGKIGSISLSDNARVMQGNTVTSAWKGAVLPNDRSRGYIGSIKATGNSRVMNGDRYTDNDDFWN
ncbi:putative HETs [Rosellinia necatrix]|uniref:Putative HETs n=1 Tax=Rosellinia necatrix TaxID=77044 RepID=A0A1W2TMA3_ROSNE|nr:putative HETs [Rosellinia necatrix]